MYILVYITHKGILSLHVIGVHEVHDQMHPNIINVMVLIFLSVTSFLRQADAWSATPIL